MEVISVRQNESKNLDLLFVQRYLYSVAKKYFAWRTLVAFLFALLGPAIAFQDNKYISCVGVAAILYLLLDNFLLERLENSKKETAAKVQELFDVSVLVLPWSGVVVGTKPGLEIIGSVLSKNSARDYVSLRDWYAVDLDRVDLALGRFFCQRSNAWWDSQLRKRYLSMLIAVLLLVFVALIIVGVFFEFTVGKLILGVILPVAPLIELLAKQIKSHFESSADVAGLKEKLDEVIEDIFKNQAAQNPLDLSRTFQDEIFRYRKNCPLIFDSVYWFFRGGQEVQMQFSVKSKIDEYLEIQRLAGRSGVST